MKSGQEFLNQNNSDRLKQKGTGVRLPKKRERDGTDKSEADQRQNQRDHCGRFVPVVALHAQSVSGIPLP
jgi:hypothetical protein